VVVHGGGPQIGEMMTRLGKVPEFKNGQRVTDEETLDIVRMVLVGRINRDLVGALNASGTPSIGVSGEDASLLRVVQMDGDLGFVGRVEEVQPDILRRLLAEGLVPVVATIGTDGDGQSYNVNADLAAGALAAALGAAKLVYLTDVSGLRRDAADPATTVNSLTAKELEAMLVEGAVTGGMAPKVRSCLDALAAGVAEAHILDGRVEHALLLELFTPEGVGTMVTP
ncbi:MAG: acetylglutamate kinase, partial [Acidimicrobiales bacterium]